MARKPIAAEYIALNEIWNNTSKETITSNVIRHITENFPQCKTSIAQQNVIADITNSKKHTVYAWINMSRDHVKIPLLKLCMIANSINVDIMKLLEKDEDHNE